MIKKSIAIFCMLIFLGMILVTVNTSGGGYDPLRFGNFLDVPSFLIVFICGAALALAKAPKNKNDFLKYFSKTAPLSGVLATLAGFINMLTNISDANALLMNLTMAALTIFYGLLFGGIAYALHRDEPDRNEEQEEEALEKSSAVEFIKDKTDDEAVKATGSYQIKISKKGFGKIKKINK